LSHDFLLREAVTVVPPAVPIDVAMVVGQEDSAAVASVAVIAAHLTPAQPVPSVGRSVIVHSVIVHPLNVPSRTVPRVVVLSRGVPPALALSVTDRLVTGPSAIARARQVTGAQHSSLVTVPRGRMRVGRLHVQRVRNAALSQPARISFGGFAPRSLVRFRLSLG
jgi:hypothetical protein